MGKQWSNARHCHAVLSILSSNLYTRLNEDSDARQRPSSTPRAQHTPQSRVQRTRSPTSAGGRESEKRQRTYNAEAEISLDAGHQQAEFSNPNFNYPAFDSTLYDNSIDLQGFSRINDLQWPDVFGQVSWEALFNRGDGYLEDRGDVF
jgi:hypothetical protein